MQKWRSVEVWNVNGYSWTKDVDAIKMPFDLDFGSFIAQKADRNIASQRRHCFLQTIWLI